jgi:SAM-dependent methyltransferase
MEIDPLLYDLQHSNEIDDIQFWSRLAAEIGGSCLELGCGTGRLLVPLAEAGIPVVGLDINFSALAFLNSSLPESLAGEMQVFQSNLDKFHLDRKFSLIFLACNTLSTLTQIVRLSSYERIFAHLQRGGLFAASFPNPAYLRSLPIVGEFELEATHYHPESGNPIQVSSGWERTEEKIAFHWQYDHLLPDGRVERTALETIHSLMGIDEYYAELKSKNLIPKNVYGDYLRSEFNEDSPYAIILAAREA